MSYVVLDFETYYDKEYSLRKMTPVEYILDPRFQVIGCAVKGPGVEPFWLDGEDLDDYLWGLRHHTGAVISHNALFDACILAWHYGVVPNLIIDTMAMSRALLYAFVGKVSLEAIADHLELPPKGTAIKHVSGMDADAIKSAGLWDTYTDYAKHDAWLCEQIFLKLLPQFPKEELAIHDMVVKCAVVPKFKLDADLLAMHASYIEAQKQGLLARCGLADRMSLMSNEKFAEALRTLGIDPPMKTSPATGGMTYAFAKSDPQMIELAEHDDERVQALVAARVGHKSTIEQTRTEKLLRISRLEWPDYSTGWCPIPLRYSGAHTHRLSGDWKLNAQNWPRYTFYDDRPKETGLLRRAHCAPPGCQVVKRDASQIEARVVAWLAEQDDLVQAFADGRDVYCEFGSHVEGRTITKADVDERFMYKTAVLGLGFGVGPDKYIKETAAKSFVTLGHSIKLDVTQGGNIVTAYRNTYHRIPAAWRTLQEAIPTLARGDVGIDTWFGPVKLEKQAVLLPNGLRLFYYDLHYDNERQEWMFKYGRMPKKLYGGKLFENIVQALARIITMNAALKMRRRYPDIGLAHQVHDDLVYIVPDEKVEEFDHALGECMNEPPAWAAGLPLASEGGIGPNYGDAH